MRAVFAGAPNLLLLETADVHRNIVFLKTIIKCCLPLQNTLRVFFGSDEVSLGKREPSSHLPDKLYQYCNRLLATNIKSTVCVSFYVSRTNLKISSINYKY